MPDTQHPLPTEPAWTPRQREVLQLLLRGRTNAQIAETLGITLDGAKWHVREIITKLGVESREEAAEYWRAHNGLRLRFSRAVRALVPASAWLKVAFASTVGVLVAGVAVATIIALHQPGEPIRAATSSATETLGQIATPVTPQPSVTEPPSTAPLTTAADIKLSAPSPSVV